MKRDHPLGILVVTCLCAWGAWETQHAYIIEDILLHWFLVGMAGISALRLAFYSLLLLWKNFILRRLMKPTDRAGSAGWASWKEIKRAKLHKKRHGLLMGIQRDNGAVFADIESAGLVLSPAGGGKTKSFVVPALCQDGTSMLVPDLKGTMACMTGKMRQTRHKHKVVYINPAKLYENILGAGVGARYNPLQILIDDWADPAFRSQLLPDAQAIAKQLYSDPPNQGEDQYWRNGSRKFMVFTFLYLVIVVGHATLSGALGLLSDPEHLKAALSEARDTDYLDGDLARLAADLLTKFKDADTKQLESFREGAVQALETFSPSSTLAESTSHCDFRFKDMRDQKMTIYLIADPTRMQSYAPWLGLLSWCAITELIRYQNNVSVTLMLDEVTNFKIHGLPSYLTSLREFKVKLWLVVQELEQWAFVYGRESLDTLLSQTEVKLVYGSQSFKTCQLISNMLGQTTIKGMSYNLGKSIFDDPATSVQDTARPLMTADEVRRAWHSILFVGNMRPIWLEQVGYNEINPWRKWVGINPLFAKPYKGKVKLRL